MGGNRDRTCLGGCQRRNESNARVARVDDQADPSFSMKGAFRRKEYTRQTCLRNKLFKLPTRGLALEILFPQPEYDSGPNGEDWLFHGEDVSFHRHHIELVLSLIGWKKFSA